MIFLFLPSSANGDSSLPPYPPSPVIKSISWEWSTLSKEFLRSDLWPVTWADDGHLYTAWGDGFGFGEKRVSMGVARIEGDPPNHKGTNVHTDTWDCAGCGKGHGILMVDGVLYVWVNMQDLTTKLFWSLDRGVTWQSSEWSFDNVDFAPATFLQYGRDYEGARDEYVYFYGGKGGDSREKHAYLVRVPKGKLQVKEAYGYFNGTDANGNATWSMSMADRQPVFTNLEAEEAQFGWHVQAVSNPGIKRYLLTSFHAGPGGLGVFDGPSPWGPWTTVYYANDFAGMGPEGFGLNSSFPQKWMSSDGLMMWNIVSVWGEGGKQGQNLDDIFNVVKTRIILQ